MNNEMINIIHWLNINKLSLNLKNTHFIIFRKRRGNIHIDNDLVVDNEKNQYVEPYQVSGSYGGQPTYLWIAYKSHQG